MIRFNFDNVALRVGGHRLLENINWTINARHSWAVIGPNGSGKTTLMRALAGQAAVVAGQIYRYDPAAQPGAIGITSFERQNDFIQRETDKDHARVFSKRDDDHLTARDLLEQSSHDIHLVSNTLIPFFRELGTETLLNKPLRQLSMGALQRVFISKAILGSAQVLVLDEPFENLDQKYRRILARLLEALIQNGTQLFLVTHLLELIPPSIGHVIALKNGQVYRKGPKAELLAPNNIARIYDAPSMNAFAETEKETRWAAPSTPLIALNNIVVSYDGKIIINGLSWQVTDGEHWMVTGPNGCGKTTLLRLLYGDHLQAYANDIRLFGLHRGQGESIWEVKQHFGWVGPEMQRHYRQDATVTQVIASGLFDTNGLYRPLTIRQYDRVRRGAELFSISHLLQRPFGHLSYGQQRMVLIARAMIKQPRILILDEPCQGLDPSNRKNLLTMADRVTQKTETQLIYVSHTVDERPQSINRQLDMSGPPYPTKTI